VTFAISTEIIRCSAFAKDGPVNWRRFFLRKKDAEITLEMCQLNRRNVECGPAAVISGSTRLLTLL